MAHQRAQYAPGHNGNALKTPVVMPLVTGAAGFTGLHLVRLLLAQGLRVAVLLRSDPPPELQRHADRLTIFQADLSDADGVRRVLAAVRPDAIFHLAALSRSDDLDRLLAANVQATENLLQGASDLARDHPVRFLLPGSAAEYGPSPDGRPMAEDRVPAPATPYGISKARQTALALSFHRPGLLEVYIGRPFNLLGPGEPPTSVCAAIARQISAIEQGRQEPILRVGNLSPERDFVDIRDAVAAYWAIITRGRPGEAYNICSGRATAVRHVLDLLLTMSEVPIEVTADSARIKQGDVSRSLGSGQKIRSHTGWQPAFSLRESLTDLLEFWRHSGQEADPARAAPASSTA